MRSCSQSLAVTAMAQMQLLNEELTERAVFCGWRTALTWVGSSSVRLRLRSCSASVSSHSSHHTPPAACAHSVSTPSADLRSGAWATQVTTHRNAMHRHTLGKNIPGMSTAGSMLARFGHRCPGLHRRLNIIGTLRSTTEEGTLSQWQQGPPQTASDRTRMRIPMRLQQEPCDSSVQQRESVLRPW